jgi:hypothetical protein
MLCVIIFSLVLVWVAAGGYGLQHILELQISLVPWVVVSSISETRIHRGLVDYAPTRCTEQYDTTP